MSACAKHVKVPNSTGDNCNTGSKARWRADATLTLQIFPCCVWYAHDFGSMNKTDSIHTCDFHAILAASALLMGFDCYLWGTKKPRFDRTGVVPGHSGNGRQNLGAPPPTPCLMVSRSQCAKNGSEHCCAGGYSKPGRVPAHASPPWTFLICGKESGKHTKHEPTAQRCHLQLDRTATKAMLDEMPCWAQTARVVSMRQSSRAERIGLRTAL